MQLITKKTLFANKVNSTVLAHGKYNEIIYPG